MSEIINIADLCGWAPKVDKQALPDAYKEFGPVIKQMPVFADTPKRYMLWEITRKLLGEDTKNYPQQDGDCVSFGSKNAGEYLQAFQLKNTDKNKWRSVFPPYIYGISRVQIGGGRLGRQAGSLGVWATQGLIKFGCLFTDVPGVPQYSKAIAQSWGVSGPPKQFIDEGSKYLLKMQMDAAKVTMWEQLKSAISNGYPVTVASSYGFSMKLGSRGYHENTDTWPHQMCIIGYDESEQYEEPCVCILNSWGNAHGEVIDKVTNEKWPVGTLRVRKSVVMRMLVDDGGDSWAYSNLDLGFVPRLPESAFSII